MNYHNILKDDMRNGSGLRVVLFVAGCEHRCEGCHNPFTWALNSGISFDDDAKQEIFDQLKESHISGLTLSGGDPLHIENRVAITELCKEVKERFPGKTIWLYTGYHYSEVYKLPVMQYIDVLVDGPFVKELADINYEWAGSRGQVIWKKKEGKWIPSDTSCRRLAEFPNYLVYANGSVYSLKSERFLKTKIDKYGYLKVRIFEKEFNFNQWVFVHRLVAKAFCEEFEEWKQVHHIDGDVQNNNAVNLQCVTNEEHAAIEKNKRGWNKKPVAQYTKKGEFVALYDSAKEASDATGICAVNICECARGVNYRKSAGGYVWKRIIRLKGGQECG